MNQPIPCVFILSTGKFAIPLNAKNMVLKHTPDNNNGYTEPKLLNPFCF